MGYARVPDWMLEDDELMHYGILGMHWGIRRFQPYPKGYDGDGKFVGKTTFISGSSKTQTKDSPYYRRKLPKQAKIQKAISDCEKELPKYGIKQQPGFNSWFTKDVSRSDIKGACASDRWKHIKPKVVYIVNDPNDSPERVRKGIAEAKAYFTKNESKIRKEIADAYYDHYLSWNADTDKSEIVSKQEFAKKLQFYHIGTSLHGIDSIAFMDDDMFFGHELWYEPTYKGKPRITLEG